MNGILKSVLDAAAGGTSAQPDRSEFKSAPPAGRS